MFFGPRFPTSLLAHAFVLYKGTTKRPTTGFAPHSALIIRLMVHPEAPTYLMIFSRTFPACLLWIRLYCSPASPLSTSSVSCVHPPFIVFLPAGDAASTTSPYLPHHFLFSFRPPVADFPPPPHFLFSQLFLCIFFSWDEDRCWEKLVAPRYRFDEFFFFDSLFTR